MVNSRIPKKKNSAINFAGEYIFNINKNQVLAGSYLSNFDPVFRGLFESNVLF